MTRTISLLAPALALLLLASPAAGQAVIMPERPLDPQRAALRDALEPLRDSLNAARMAGGRLTRDIRQVSELTLVSRARVVRDACKGATETMPAARKAVTGDVPDDRRRSYRRAELLKAFDEVAAALAVCEREFGEMVEKKEAERIRGYGPDRVNRLRTAINRYESKVNQYMAAYGIPYLPKSQFKLAG